MSKFAFEYQPAAWGDRARAVPGGSEANRERSPAVPDEAFPRCRCDARPPSSGRTAERYGRAEASAVTTAADTDTELVHFSGRVDTVTLTAHDFAAVFILRDDTGRELVEYFVDAFGVHESHVACNRVSVRNHVAGSAAHVQAVGKWVGPDEW
jgi:hypothetical protein